MALSIPLGKALALYSKSLHPKLIGVLFDQNDFENRIRNAISADRGGYELDATFFLMREVVSNCGETSYEITVRGDCNHHYVYGYYISLVDIL